MANIDFLYKVGRNVRRNEDYNRENVGEIIEIGNYQPTGENYAKVRLKDGKIVNWLLSGIAMTK